MFIRGLRNVPFSTVVVLITFLAIGFCEHQKFIKSWVKETVPVPDFSRFGIFDIFTEDTNYEDEVDLSDESESDAIESKKMEINMDPTFWNENDKKIEERFKKRRERLEKYCRSIENQNFQSWQTRNRHFYVGDAEHKLLGCVPLKAGCTSWIYWQTSQKHPNSTTYSMGSALRSVGEIGKEVGQQLIEGDDATRFLVVRHPLFRFYSGFRQKFKKADPLHVKLLKKSGYLRERNQAHVESTDDDMTITFADFGHFIGSMIPKSSTFNSHFRPQFHACQERVVIYIKLFLFPADFGWQQWILVLKQRSKI
ncbi:unnamed protein product [Oikopleura dioica]|uniref:Carbohydrate sulfotransferase n=1 Tax=Oikopleura dioica TaxID=34765 RepID=E4Y9V7_OIKDI|nr:unnamed protein product [Oikopleura dioica]